MTDIIKLDEILDYFLEEDDLEILTSEGKRSLKQELKELEQYYQDKIEKLESQLTEYKQDHEAISNYRTQFVEYNEKITQLKEINLMLETDNGDLSVKLEKLEKENSELHIKTDFLETEK